jgi:site-specific DNA recombinase
VPTYVQSGPAPFGYKTIVAETRGKTEKKKLEINPQEADVVRLVYDLYTDGDKIGTKGIRGISYHLNEKGYRQRNGSKFYSSVIDTILHREAYTSIHYYNRTCSKTKRQKRMDSNRNAYHYIRRPICSGKKPS